MRKAVSRGFLAFQGAKRSNGEIIRRARNHDRKRIYYCIECEGQRGGAVGG